MKNFKKVLALVLTVAMVLSSMTFAFAQTVVQNQEKAEVLFDLGLFKGANPDKFEPRLENDMNRAEAVTMVIRLLGWDADATAEIPFKDKELSGDYAWAKPFIAKAYEEGITVGNSATEFGVVEKVTLQQYATFLLRALGYDINGENYAQAPEMAYEVGLLSLADVLAADKAAIRDQLVGVSYNALFASEKDSDVTLLEKLIADEKVTEDQVIKSGDADLIALLEEVTTGEDLAIASVVADNLKEVVVTFNREISEIKNEDFEIRKLDTNGKAGSKVDTTATLSEDKQEVVVAVKADKKGLDNKARYQVTIKNVKDADGNQLAETKEEFAAFDASLPEVKDIKVTGPKSIEIEFTEPIKEKGEVKVKTGTSTLSISSAYKGYNTNKIQVELYSTFQDGKTYTVSVNKFEDFAGYPNAPVDLEINYVKDTTPPVATVEKAEAEYLVLNFDKPVKGLKEEQFYHTYTAYQSIGIYKDVEFKNAVTTSDSVNKVYVVFYDKDNKDSRPLPNGKVNFGIKGSDIKDNWGNKLGDYTVEITVNANQEAPKVTKLEVKGEKELKVTFNRLVKLDSKNVEILKEDGSKESGLYFTIDPDAKTSAKEFTITLSKSMAGKTIIVNIKDVEDQGLSKEKFELYSETITVTDKTAPKVNKVTAYTNNDEYKLYVFFSEAVDGETALNVGNYYLANEETTTKLTKDVSFYTNDATVEIVLTEKEFNKINIETTKLFITGVKDIAGNEIADRYTKAIQGNNTNKPVINKVKATKTDLVEVEFDQVLTKVEKEAFTVNGKAAKGMEVVENDNKTTVKLTLETELSYDPQTDNAKLKIVDGSLIKNVFDVSADTVEETINDAIKPEIAKYTDDDNKDKEIIRRTKDNEIEITFTEAINGQTVSAMTFEVENATVTAAKAEAEGKKVILTISPKDGMAPAPRITQVHELKDMNNNSYKADKVLDSFDVRSEVAKEDAFKAVNSSKDAAEMKNALENNNLGLTLDYKDLADDKKEAVAGKVLANRPETGYENKEAIQAAFDAAVEAVKAE